MTFRLIVKAIAQAVVLALLFTSNSGAQQGGESARGASKPTEAVRAPAKKTGRKLASNTSDAARIPARSLDPRCVPKSGADTVPIARLLNVTGNVLVSTDSGLTAVEPGQAVQIGARVMTMTNSSVLVQYCDGCDIRLGANQRYEISLGESCSERLALRESTLLEPGDAAAAALATSDAEVVALAASASTSMTAAVLAGIVPASTPLVGGIGLTGAVAAIRDRLDEAVSPN